MICYLNSMYHFEEGLMADERKLNEQPSINKDYYYNRKPNEALDALCYMRFCEKVSCTC